MQERLNQGSGTEGAVQLTEQQLAESTEIEEAKDDIEFIAFARVFSGVVKPGDQLYVLGPKYNPSRLLLLNIILYKDRKI